MTTERVKGKALAGTLLALGLVLAACGTPIGQKLLASRVSRSSHGRTATVAQLFAPDFIFPYFPPADATVANELMQSDLYRPLYYTPANNGTESLNEEASAALPPKWTHGGRTAVITLKSWKWSNGKPLTSRDVIFWLNMMKAEPSSYGLYIPGEIPDNIVSYRAAGTRTVDITFNRVYAHDFLLYNNLSEVTPMPLAWDLTKNGHPGHCATDVHACGPVLKYLLGQSKTPTSFASNRLWSIVDGPWRLKSFSTNGSFVLVPNRKYSGSPKPRLGAVSFETFTSETTEYNVLRSGNGSIDVGFVPLQDVGQKPPNRQYGSNPVKGYRLAETAFWGAIPVTINMNNPKVGTIFRQTYLRQVLQRAVDQKGMIKAFMSGYGYPQGGPISSVPKNPFQASVDRKGGPFPFNLKKARSILKSHGWKVVRNGTDHCVHAGSSSSECGKGVAAGAKLSFTASFVSTPDWVGQAMAAWKSDLSSIGVQLSLKSGPFSTVYGGSQACKPSQASCSWEMANFDGISNYTYPVGALYFSTKGALNYGSWDNATADKLIDDTLVDSNPAAMRRYDLYLAKEVPMVWFPMPVGGLNEIKNNLQGVTSKKNPDPVAFSLPELWYFKKK